MNQLTDALGIALARWLPKIKAWELQLLNCNHRQVYAHVLGRKTFPVVTGGGATTAEKAYTALLGKILYELPDNYNWDLLDDVYEVTYKVKPYVNWEATIDLTARQLARQLCLLLMPLEKTLDLVTAEADNSLCGRELRRKRRV